MDPTILHDALLLMSRVTLWHLLYLLLLRASKECISLKKMFLLQFCNGNISILISQFFFFRNVGVSIKQIYFFSQKHISETKQLHGMKKST